ncbi:HypC/HybG/HupF family hydrogenase formation chaperone [Vibrio algicola]|uniref:HypC/HybG/HupF family hydrogenase formation chaperone n=1 Tax=Vibrio algicola TaxID=2662262 RepID=A0A5Q0TH35_9VIBR|nr:HypC/HybG/HupF family hydrogenase formation chaperone [Vibrio algicola]
MCIGIPSQVVALGNGTARVRCLDSEREVSLLLMSDNVELGDYLLIQAGGFAVEVWPESDALATLALLTGSDNTENSNESISR